MCILGVRHAENRGCLVAIPSNRVNVSYKTRQEVDRGWRLDVAIPSNRVNVSYVIQTTAGNLEFVIFRSQSPQIGSMFPTALTCTPALFDNFYNKSQSPQIGSMFPTFIEPKLRGLQLCSLFVAIPSNRVNVSYADAGAFSAKQMKLLSRNPLKSGQCFLRSLVS